MLAHVPFFGWNPRGSPDFLAYPVPKACMCCGLFLGNSLVFLCLLFLKIPNPKSTNLAGSLDGAPIHNTNSKTKTLSRD